MALQIWLPLDGDIRNLGVSSANMSVMGTGVTFTDGKIGKAATFPNSCASCLYTDGLKLQIFSWAAWIKVFGEGSGSSQRIISEGRDTGSVGTNIYTNKAGTALAWTTHKKNGSISIELNRWYHVTLTADGSNIRFYIDGELKSTTAYTEDSDYAQSNNVFVLGKMAYGYTNTGNYFPFNGQLNDVRVYDHCLSAAEVKEISKGLILHYKLDNIVDDIRIIDSSGYSHHGSIKNTVEIETDTTRYLKSINLPNGNSAINCGRGGMVTDSITYSMWINYSTWGNPVSCTEGGGWNFETNPVQLAINIESIGYLHAVSSFQPTANEWHMLTGVYDRLNQKAYIYIDGQMTGETNASSPNLIHYNGSNVIWLGVEASGSATAFASNGMIGKISDFRIYCTALSAEDILDLYHTSAKIDKTGKVHTFEFVEDEDTKITKTGIVEEKQFAEYSELEKLKYDPNTYIEPDGSAWVRIFHHNNPASKSFSSSDDFANSVYIDEDRWFNMEVCNSLTTWEIMVKSKKTAEDTESKFRWIQSVNPMTATFNDVSSSNITKVITGGYTTSSFGGLYLKNQNAYLAANNGNSGNWWGAVGAWVVWGNGLPGYVASGSSGADAISTGFEDVYVRIDNQDMNNLLLAKFKKLKNISANEFIEK